MFTVFATLFAFLALSVNASPLSRRDVIAPRITSPNAQTVWPIGTVQTVTWDTSNFPPDSQITNPIGQVILGFNSSDSLNLDFMLEDFKCFVIDPTTLDMACLSLRSRTVP
uniref:Uncharacterized protein n=1 Tax=Psilocybe cubensis TaxID=181762 RepID=A0A8H8CF13_PSICU